MANVKTPDTNRRYLLAAVLLALALYVLLPQVGAFKSSWRLLGRSDGGWTAIALGCVAITYLAGGLTYYLLAIKRLRYWRTVLVQLAAMFVNRLLPAGVGSLGVNYAYLRHEKHKATQSGTVVAMNNSLGVVGHGVLAVLALAAYSGVRSLTPDFGHSTALVLRVIGLAVLALVITAIILGWRRFKRQLISIGRQILDYRNRPLRLASALLSSMVLTLSNVLGLMACALAVGVHLPFVVVFLIFSFGLGTGTATPVPGGLGGFEAGMTAGFIAYRVPAGHALAVTLLFRLVSYWLPLGFGALAFIVCQRKNLFSARY